MEKEFEIKDLKFKGYVTFYIALFSETEATIVKFESDFQADITEEAVRSILEYFIKYYKNNFDMNVTSVQFVSKEVYEAYCEKYHDHESVTLSWSGDKIFIDGKEVEA